MGGPLFESAAQALTVAAWMEWQETSSHHTIQETQATQTQA